MRSLDTFIFNKKINLSGSSHKNMYNTLVCTILWNISKFYWNIEKIQFMIISDLTKYLKFSYILHIDYNIISEYIVIIP